MVLTVRACLKNVSRFILSFANNQSVDKTSQYMTLDDAIESNFLDSGSFESGDFTMKPLIRTHHGHRSAGITR